MFRGLLGHLQEGLNKRHLVRILSACYVSWLHPGRARNIPSAACVAPPDDDQVMLETFRGP
jgi:hypothetical protein